MRRRAVRVGAGALALILAGVIALPASAATQNVFIQGSAFDPPTATIAVGDFVTWTNRDAGSHTTTSVTGNWDSGLIANGASWSRQFTAPGTFTYFCSLHSFMQGTIVVRAAATAPPPTAPPTPPPTTPPTARPTVAPPTVVPTVAPATTAPAPTATASADASPSAVATLSLTASPSPTAVAAVAAPTQAAPPQRELSDAAGPGPVLVALAGMAIVGLLGIAWRLLRRT